MQIKVIYLGVLKEIAGKSSHSVELADGATAADLWAKLIAATPKLGDRSVAIAINQEYAQSSAVLHHADEVALLPPVSGGLPESVATAADDLRSAHCRITRDVIDANAIVAEIKVVEDGAACIFDGVVRNNTRGRRTLYLEYEGYEQMALKEMEALAMQAMAQFGVRDVRIVHRLGHMDIGETSVLIAVASAHRGETFDACRWIIDSLKKVVPIWKKEFFEDGAVWADGEDFPAEIDTRRG